MTPSMRQISNLHTTSVEIQVIKGNLVNRDVQVTVGERPKAGELETEKAPAPEEEDSEHSILWTNHVAVLLPKRKSIGKEKVANGSTKVKVGASESSGKAA